MADFFATLSEELIRFIGEQQMFFVASAPLSETTHINLSPKGGNSLRVLANNRIAYLDYTGSGNETAAHLLENGRLTMMWCSFGPSPKILRLYGKGRVVAKGSEEWDALYANFEPNAGARQITILEVELGQTSCGYAVPLYTFDKQRGMLDAWADRKGETGLKAYRRDNNRVSLDGMETGLVDV